MINYEVIMSKQAHSTVKRNIKFLRKFSIPYSLKTEYCIYKSIVKLKQFPHINAIYKKTTNCVYRKLIIMKRYNIIYAVIKNTIYIFYIYDGRQAYDKYFESLK